MMTRQIRVRGTLPPVEPLTVTMQVTKPEQNLIRRLRHIRATEGNGRVLVSIENGGMYWQAMGKVEA